MNNACDDDDDDDDVTYVYDDVTYVCRRQGGIRDEKRVTKKGH